MSVTPLLIAENGARRNRTIPDTIVNGDGVLKM
jgi:hypothetical protein